METSISAGKVRRPLLALPNMTTSCIRGEKTCTASPVEGLRDIFICTINRTQSDRSFHKRSMTTMDHVVMVLDEKSIRLRKLSSAETAVRQALSVGRREKQLQDRLLAREEQLKSQINKQVHGREMQTSFLTRIFNFKLSWSENKDFLKLFIGKERVYTSRRMYVRHARHLVRRYQASTVEGKSMKGSELRMIAFLVTVKAVEDDAVWDVDFLDTYPELAANEGPAFTLKKIFKLERDFLRVIDWKTHVTFKKKSSD